MDNKIDRLAVALLFFGCPVSGLANKPKAKTFMIVLLLTIIRFAGGGLPASWGSAAGVTCREPAASRMRPQTPAAAEAARRLGRVGALDPANMVVLLLERTALALPEGVASGSMPASRPTLLLGGAGGQQNR